jgi:uncharacterized protein YraI
MALFQEAFFGTNRTLCSVSSDNLFKFQRFFRPGGVPMRPTSVILLAFLLCAVVFAGATAQGEQDFPYKAFVATDEVYVRSGPGQNYYPTDKLSKGQEVEVFRHDPGGWCAIKPVEGSFSWISSQYAEIKEGNLAIITGNKVSARVGSKFSDIRGTEQVHLKKGEVVEVLETKKIGSGNSPSQTWYKIAPPSGEFRWVSLKYLEPAYAHEGLRHRDGDRGYRDGEGEVASSGERGRHPRPEKRSHEAFQAELDRLELELSQMVVEESNVWSFDSLRIGAESLVEEASTGVERGKARLLISRIDRFEDIKNRSEKLAVLRDETDRSNKYIAGLRSTVQRARDFVDPGSDRYDGVGRLERVPPLTPGVPQFALMDEVGNVRSYITPSTGVNLYKYEGKQIGVVGQRGYIPNKKAQQVTASHITLLDGQVLR